MRFYYLLKAGYASRLENPTFSISTIRRCNFNLLRIEEELSAAHLRLSRVYIENLPYADIFKRFDRPHTFFYVDPPYYRCENYYGKGIFSREDFGRLRDILNGLKGKFMMSINDTKEIREIYRGFHIEKVKTKYSVSTRAGGKRDSVTELLVMNFKPKIK